LRQAWKRLRDDAEVAKAFPDNELVDFNKKQRADKKPEVKWPIHRIAGAVLRGDCNRPGERLVNAVAALVSGSDMQRDGSSGRSADAGRVAV